MSKPLHNGARISKDKTEQVPKILRLNALALASKKTPSRVLATLGIGTQQFRRWQAQGGKPGMEISPQPIHKTITFVPLKPGASETPLDASFFNKAAACVQVQCTNAHGNTLNIACPHDTAIHLFKTFLQQEMTQ